MSVLGYFLSAPAIAILAAEVDFRGQNPQNPAYVRVLLLGNRSVRFGFSLGFDAESRGSGAKNAMAGAGRKTPRTDT